MYFIFLGLNTLTTDWFKLLLLYWEGLYWEGGVLGKRMGVQHRFNFVSDLVDDASSF